MPQPHTQKKNLKIVSKYCNTKKICKMEPPQIQPGYFYILKTRQSQLLNQNIFKIGKTCKTLPERAAGYPKHARLLFAMFVQNPRQTELNIKRRFKQEFEQAVEEHGKNCEYFRGNYDEMKQIAWEIISAEPAPEMIVHPAPQPQQRVVVEVNVIANSAPKRKKVAEASRASHKPENNLTHQSICDWCNKAFSTPHWLDYHKYETNVPCNLKCRKCGKVCGSKYIFRKHVKQCM